VKYFVARLVLIMFIGCVVPLAALATIDPVASAKVGGVAVVVFAVYVAFVWAGERSRKETTDA
jgi:hypothetical protein